MFVLQFPPSCGSSCLTSASLSGPSESFRAKLTFFVFTAPLISSCFVPPPAAPDIAWCAEGMQLPEEFPRWAPPFLVPNFTLTNWPGVPLPLTSLCFPWQLGPVHELTGPVHPVQNTSQWRHGMDGHLTAAFSAESNKTERGVWRRRQGEEESETVCGWSVRDFCLKIEPVSFSPFASFFV